MDVRALMTKDPAACLLGDSCGTAGRLMGKHDCGFLPVMESARSRRVIGVVTDRDIALHLAESDRPASAVPVDECMTRTVHSIGASEDLDDAVHIMETAKVRRLPVIEQDQLVGVLSLEDLAREARKEWSSPKPHRVERQMSELLEVIASR